jgi:hypothetical protein
VVAQNSTLIHPGPQVNSPGIVTVFLTNFPLSLSFFYSTWWKSRQVFDTIYFSERQEFDMLNKFHCPKDVYLVVTPCPVLTDPALEPTLIASNSAIVLWNSMKSIEYSLAFCICHGLVPWIYQSLWYIYAGTYPTQKPGYPNTRTQEIMRWPTYLFQLVLVHQSSTILGKSTILRCLWL